MFDEVRLDLHGVCNLSHVLTIKISYPHLETEEDLSAVPFPVHFHFWLNFKLKREQESAAESMFNLMNQDVLVLLPTAHGKSSYCKCTGCIRRRNNMKPFVRLPASSKTRLPKQEYLEWSVCPSWSWTLTVFVCACMLLWKVVYNFPENSELPRSFFQRKLVLQFLGWK